MDQRIASPAIENGISANGQPIDQVDKAPRWQQEIAASLSIYVTMTWYAATLQNGGR